MITKKSIPNVMPKTNTSGGVVTLGVLSVLLAIPTLLYMWLAKKEKDKKEVYY